MLGVQPEGATTTGRTGSWDQARKILKVRISGWVLPSVDSCLIES